MLLAAFSARPQAAQAGNHHGCHSCPDCGCKTCRVERETIKEKKHCWEIECKDVCIPKFKWPWEDCCCLPECGRVRTVKKLKKVEYECEKCGYKWTIEQVCNGCGQCGQCGPGGDGGCNADGACADAACEQQGASEEAAPSEAAPAVPMASRKDTSPVKQASAKSPLTGPLKVLFGK